MIDFLPFDSSLFGYKVGKYQADESWNESSFIEESRDFDLVYIFSKGLLSPESKNISLTDTKMVFGKDLSGTISLDQEISNYSGESTKELMSLALESGKFSRFNTDPGFNKGEFEKLYKVWLEKSLQNKEVLIAAKMAGFITCHVKEEIAQVGLIAVDNAKRGKGWGKKLVSAAEAFALRKGAKFMHIGTQEANSPAVNLYLSQGYCLLEKTYVYHYRRLKSS